MNLKDDKHVMCNLCPRKCNKDRRFSAADNMDIIREHAGFCQMPRQVFLARAALHMWEEPCISGKNGSGAVFFTGCQLRCVFCQNYNIAAGRDGKEISVERLSEIFLELQDKKANNINLVTPSHYVPVIITALEMAKAQGLVIPIVYNTSSYENVDTLKRLEGLIDVYLPDMKYMSSQAAEKYSHAPDYPEVAKRAIAEMYRQTGKPLFNEKLLSDKKQKPDEKQISGRKTKADENPPTDQSIYGDKTFYNKNIEDGIMLKGMIVRHLMLPGLLNDSKEVIKYLYDTYNDNCYISIMNQYTPLLQVRDIKELNRHITKREYNKVVDYAIDLGVENAFIQEGGADKDSFIPEFNYEGVEKKEKYQKNN